LQEKVRLGVITGLSVRFFLDNFVKIGLEVMNFRVIDTEDTQREVLPASSGRHDIVKQVARYPRDSTIGRAEV